MRPDLTNSPADYAALLLEAQMVRTGQVVAKRLFPASQHDEVLPSLLDAENLLRKRGER